MINVLYEFIKEADNEPVIWDLFSDRLDNEGVICVKPSLPAPLDDHTFYLIICDNEALVVLWDYNKKIEDELVDEENFNDELPLWFTQSSHRVSPVYKLRICMTCLKKALEKLYPPKNVLVKGVMLTNSRIVNYEETKGGYDQLAGIVIKDRINLDTRCLPTSTIENPNMEFCIKYISHNAHKVEVASLRIDELERITISPDDIDEDGYYLPHKSIKTASEIRNEIAEDEKQLMNVIDCDHDILFPREDARIHSVDELVDFLGYTPDTLRKTETAVTAEGNEVTVNREVSLPNVEIYYPIDDPQQRLDDMIGLEAIKEKLFDLSSLFEYNVMKGAYSRTRLHQVNLHATFVGNPGTGKTTMARVWSSLLHKYDQLEAGHLVLATRSSFIGKTWGSEEEALRRIIDIAQGGTLLIDEAYSLVSSHPQDPGRMVLPLLLNLLADESFRNISVILAGYPIEMKALLKSNPGITSRFPNNFEFKDFSFDQLCDITISKTKQYNYSFTPAAWKKYKAYLAQAYAKKDRTHFGNARFVVNYLERIYLEHAKRIVRKKIIDKDEILKLTVADIVPLEESAISIPTIGFSSISR